MTKVGFWKEFQYISCYCLSSYSRRPVRLACDFNTSHVTVYPRTTHLPNSGYHFNTSHVTVYHMPSVHNCITITFQYISCYCLSLCKETIRRRNLISIHLMLLFIQYHLTTSSADIHISIHLMLLFITGEMLFRFTWD